MRKVLVAAAALIAAMGGAFATSSPAIADGSITLNLGPGIYSVGYIHPTGTITLAGGTISARCTGTSLIGRAVNQTPQCATRVITCPLTSSGCSVVVTAGESALRSPVAFDGQVIIVGSVPTITVLSPYNCPQKGACGTQVRYDGLTPGSTVQVRVWNISNVGLANIAAQASLTYS